MGMVYTWAWMYVNGRLGTRQVRLQPYLKRHFHYVDWVQTANRPYEWSPVRAGNCLYLNLTLEALTLLKNEDRVLIRRLRRVRHPVLYDLIDYPGSLKHFRDHGCAGFQPRDSLREFRGTGNVACCRSHRHLPPVLLKKCLHFRGELLVLRLCRDLLRLCRGRRRNPLFKVPLSLRTDEEQLFPLFKCLYRCGQTKNSFCVAGLGGVSELLA